MRRIVNYPTKLFTLMMLYFIGFSSLLLLVSGFVYYETYSKTANREIRETAMELLEERSQNLSNYVTGIQDTALFLVTNKLVQQNLSLPPDNVYDFVKKSRELSEEFQKMATVKTGLHSIELYTDWLDGYPQFQEHFMHPVSDAIAEGWISRMDKADGFWIPSHDYGAMGGSISVVSYVHRIGGLHGEILGIVKINIPSRQLLQNLSAKNASQASDHYYLVMDSNGSPIASMLPPGMRTPDIAAPLEKEIAGTDYSVIQSDANAQGWVLAQFISKDILKQSGEEIRSLIALLLSGLILLSIPLAFWVSRKLTSPIHGIVEGMRAVEKGDFNVRMQASSIQEYLYLTTHFNRMVQRLKGLIERLNQEHRDRREAEIQLLHAQIKPHFLYNTLDLIHWRALDYNAHEISRMVQQLSRLFRIGLSNDNWYVTVRDELNHARCYMAIQEFRQNFNLKYIEHIESDLFDAIIPKIIVQPFLENAVIHGNWQRGEEAVVSVSFDQREAGGSRQLYVTISDNGRGLPEGFHMQSTRGIGIRNVVDRIQLYCGPKYGVQVASDTTGGVQVVIKLPLLRHKEEMEQLTRSLIHENDSLGG